MGQLILQLCIIYSTLAGPIMCHCIASYLSLTLNSATRENTNVTRQDKAKSLHKSMVRAKHESRLSWVESQVIQISDSRQTWVKSLRLEWTRLVFREILAFGLQFVYMATVVCGFLFGPVSRWNTQWTNGIILKKYQEMTQAFCLR